MINDVIAPEISDIQTKFAQLGIGEEYPSTTGIDVEKIVPKLYWQCIGRSGGTYTAGVDWDAQFDDPGATRWKYKLPTSAGEISFLIRDNASSPQRRAKITIDALRPFPVTFDMRLTAGRLQVKFNGTRTEYTASAQVTLQFKEGRNTLSLSLNSTSGDLLFLGESFDGVNAWWVNPTVSPARKTINNNGSTGGGSGGGISISLENPGGSGE